MLRVGFYSGKVYSQKDYDSGDIWECCTVVSPTLPEDEAIKQAKEFALCQKTKHCEDCKACKISKGEG